VVVVGGVVVDGGGAVLGAGAAAAIPAIIPAVAPALSPAAPRREPFATWRRARVFGARGVVGPCILSPCVTQSMDEGSHSEQGGRPVRMGDVDRRRREGGPRTRGVSGPGGTR
jgi:hypothetical protein